MFSIRLEQAAVCCNELESQSRQLRDQLYGVQQVKSNLSGLSGMDNVRRSLDNQISAIENEYYILSQMLQTLNKILLNYSKCENRICDNAEQSIIVYQRREIGNNDFTGLRNIINGIY
jgi:hypothetical protein